MNKKPVLIVDDEPDLCELLALTLKRLGLDSEIAHSLSQAKVKLQQQHYAMCLTDMRLDDGNGLDLVSHITSNHHQTPVAVITAHGNMDTAIEALKRGAFDFINKPIELAQLKSIITAATQLPDVKETTADNETEGLTGASATTSELRQLLLKVARSQAPVYIHGESGVGKEVCARIIHQHSARKDGPFIAVNCGAIPSELVESEFFGHKKGSFTGATSDQPGLFLSANGGTLLLDEIADLPQPMQVKLLRAIQEKTVRAVGSNRETPVDVRIISATHKDLRQLVDQNQFRNDLYYRINVIEINVPPLRERKDDIKDIATQILKTINAHASAAPPYRLSTGALDRLVNYTFPGNIRELENILERTTALCEPGNISADDLVFRKAQPQDNSANKSISSPLADEALANEQGPDAFDPSAQSLDDYLQAIEKRELIHALEQNRWNKTETAKYLGMSFRSLRYRLKKLGLDD